MTNLTQRLITATLLAPPIIAAIWFGGIWFLALLGFIGAVLIWEWIKLTGGNIASPLTALYVAALLGVLINLWETSSLNQHSLAVIITAMVGALLLAQILKTQKLFACLGVAYLLVPLILLADLRADESYGALALLSFLLIVWASDSGGYFIGRTFGGAKLAPNISENKTWSGAFGSLVFAFLTAAILFFALELSQKLLLWGIVISIATQSGDLLESYIKRLNKVKDSSNLLLGHGGFLDRMDGLLIAIIVFYIIFLFFAAAGESAAHLLIKG